MHPCFLCNSGETSTSLCAICAEDLEALGETLPAPDATKDEVLAWAKANKVQVFVCKKADGTP
jgi:hypothetical protein